jgi:hypothetical protein
MMGTCGPAKFGWFCHNDPLEQPNRKKEAVTKLKYILLDDGFASSPYARLLIELVVDPL